MGTYLRRARRRHCARRYRPLLIETFESRRLLADLASDLGINLDTAEVQANAAMAASDGVTSTSTTAPAYSSSDILVRFRDGAELSALAPMPGAAGSEPLPIVTGLQQIHLAPGASLAETVASFRSRSDVLYAEPNYLIHSDALPNDSRFAEQWDLNNTGQSSGTSDADIDAPEAWDVATGSQGVVVGIIDTGVDYTHPDLAANIWTNTGEIPANGIDDDHDGFIDDVHGFNFNAHNGDPMDDNGHGTHVAGILGAVGNNGIGITGVAWHVQIMALKFLDGSGLGDTADAISAINYAAMMHSRGVNIKLTSNSWETIDYSQAMQDAIAATKSQGMLFIAAAGNSGRDSDATPSYPAGFPLDNIISVAATERNDKRASFSNWGAKTIDLAAPGYQILSTYLDNSYVGLSGTSMATPHVAGVAALAWSVAPSATYQEIRDAIFAGVDKVADFRIDGPTPVATGGRLNALGTLQRLKPFVLSTTPASGTTVRTPPTSYVVNFILPVVPATVQPGQWTVNGKPANAVVVNAEHTSATFTFNTNPVVAEGPQSMHLTGSSILREGNGNSPLGDYTATFYYGVTPLQVVSTSPPAGGVFPLPGPFTYDLTFNQALDPTSVQLSDLQITGAGTEYAKVTGATLINNNQTARFTISGVTDEVALTATIAAGALNDVYGNPNTAAFVYDYTSDSAAASPIRDLVAVEPRGSFIYSGTVSKLIKPAGDTDSYTVAIDPGQTLTVLVRPVDNSLRPTVVVRDQTAGVNGSATAPAPGQSALVQTLSVPVVTTVSIDISGANGTTGAYTLQLVLNAAEELESLGGPSNDTRATAQNIDSSFIAPGFTPVQRGAVVGGQSTVSGWMSNVNFEDGQAGYVIDNTPPPGNAPGLWHLSTRRGTQFGHSGATSFYYGNESTGNYNTAAQPNSGSITSQPISLAANSTVTLSFSYVLVNESSSFDIVSVLVSTDGGTSFTTLASSEDPEQLPATSDWKTLSFNLSAYVGQTIRLRFNFDTVNAQANNYEGWYVDDVQISAIGWSDYYSFTAAANDTVSVAIKSAGNSTAQISIEDSVGNLLTSGIPASYPDSAISSLLLPADGTYFIHVTGANTLAYQLVVLKNADFDLEPNDDQLYGQPVLSAKVSGQQYVLGRIDYQANDDYDYYSVNVPPTTTFTAEVVSPWKASGEPSSPLSPSLSAWTRTGCICNSSKIIYTTGKTAEIIPLRAGYLFGYTDGRSDYIISLSGTTVTPPAFSVKSAILDRATPGNSATSLLVDFTTPYFRPSVTAPDLLIDGQPTASGVTVVSATSIRFSLQPLAPGLHTFSLPTGSLLDIHGTSLTAFSIVKSNDSTPPTVLRTSVETGGSLAPGNMTYQVTFSEPMNVANLSSDDFVLRLTGLAKTFAPTGFSFDATGTILTLNYANIVDGTYDLTLVSGAAGGHFADPADNALDGNFRGTFPSGDGVASGNFAIRFVVDTIISTLPNITPQLPAGSLIYSTSLDSNIDRVGDVDRDVLTLDAGQSLTVVMTPTDPQLIPKLEVRTSSDVVLASATAPAAGKPAVLQTFYAAEAGNYIIVASGLTNTIGSYSLNVALNAAIQVQIDKQPTNVTFATAQDITAAFIPLAGAPAGVTRAAVIGNTGFTYESPSYYAFHLEQNDVASFYITGLNTGVVDLQLFDINHNLVTRAINGALNVTKAIRNYIIPFSGTYYLCVDGRTNADYTVLATTNAAYESESNDTILGPQVLSNMHWVLGNTKSGDDDWYRVAADGGALLSITSRTPGDGPGQFNNTLDPHLELYDDTNTRVAVGVPLTDGRNETIQYQPKQPGSFRLRVKPDSGAGEYTLQLGGNLATPLPFQTTTISLTDGSILTSSPSDFTVSFNRTYLASSVQKEDLLVDGIASATGITFPLGDTISFQLPKLSDGPHTFNLLSSSIVDFQGTPLSGTTINIALDATPPKITGTSIPPGATTLPGSLTYQVAFSEPVTFNKNNLTSTFSLAPLNSLYQYIYPVSSSLNATGTVLTLTFTNLAENFYSLTVTSPYILDRAGNALDGEYKGTFPTGNTQAGGNFEAIVNVDLTTVPFPSSLTEQPPLGSMIFSGSTSGYISPAGDSDAFTFPVSAGQRITVQASLISGSLNSTLELRDPTGAVLATATSDGKTAVLQSVAAPYSGNYQITVGGAGTTTGYYTLTVTLNAALEAENIGGPVNDTTATAQNLDASSIAIGPGASRLAVVGALGLGQKVTGEDFESGSIPPSIKIYSSDTNGRIWVSLPISTGNYSNYVLRMYSPFFPSYTLNEAVYHVNLSGLTQANLRFSYVVSYDNADLLPTTFVDHANGDGVAISDDGVHWRTILNAPTATQWTTVTYDLASLVASAGMHFGPDFQIKFQQYGRDYGFRYYDDIQIAVSDTTDHYQVTLAAGDTVTTALSMLAGLTASVQVVAANGVVLSNTGSVFSVGEATSSAVVPSTGVYDVIVSGAPNALYNLVILKNAAFDNKNNSSFATAQDISPAASVLGNFYGSSSAGEDWYQLNVTSTALPLRLTTSTPSAWPQANTLNPHLELYDPNNLRVAAGALLADGLNESIAYQPLITGAYRVRVTRESLASGDYVLSRNVQSAALSLANLTISSPIAEGSSATLTGIYLDQDPSSAHTITIDWGKSPAPGNASEGTTTLTTAGSNPPNTSLISLGGSRWQFTACHAYYDDAPPATATAIYSVGVTVANNHQQLAQASTSLTVTNVAPMPSFTVATSPLLERQPISLIGTAPDLGGPYEPLTFAWKIYKESQSVSFASGNTKDFSFTPDIHGDYRVELTASDDDGGVATYVQTITVADVPVVVSNVSTTTPEDTALAIPLPVVDSPADLANLQYRIVAAPKHGTLSGTTSNVIYLPAANYIGPDWFTFDVGDGKTFINPATVSINVTPVNDPPTFQNLAGNLTAWDEDPTTHGPALQQSVPLWATNISAGAPDEAGQSLNFIVTGTNIPYLFAVPPVVALDGTLTFTPRPNTSGITHLSVVLHDNGSGADTSLPAFFTIQIVKTHPLHNAAETGKRNGLDVAGSTTTAPDGIISAGDVVAVINYINARGQGHTQTNPEGPPYCDVTDDDEVAADDVIAIINYINAHPGPTEASDLVTTTAVPDTLDVNSLTLGDPITSDTVITADLIDLLAADTASTALKRRRI